MKPYTISWGWQLKACSFWSFASSPTFQSNVHRDIQSSFSGGNYLLFMRIVLWGRKLLGIHVYRRAWPGQFFTLMLPLWLQQKRSGDLISSVKVISPSMGDGYGGNKQINNVQYRFRTEWWLFQDWVWIWELEVEWGGKKYHSNILQVEMAIQDILRILR